MRILLEDTLAITIDFQERLIPAIYKNDEVVERSEILIKGLKVLGVPNIVTRQYPKGIGETIEPIKVLTSDDSIYDKISFSCYDDENIKKAVDSQNKKNIILFGIEAHVCVLQTLIDLREAGYNVILVTDCISSRKKSDKKIAIKRAISEGAILATSESILFELTRAAGTDKFKEISRLVK